MNRVFIIILISFFFNILLIGQPNIVKGPYLMKVTPSAISIHWETDSNTSTKSWFGLSTTNLNDSILDLSLSKKHQVSLINLLPATQYFYVVGDKNVKLKGDTMNYFCANTLLKNLISG